MMPGRFKLSVLILLILLSPAGASMAEAQLAPAEAGAETPAEEEWTAPDLLNLPSDWLTQLDGSGSRAGRPWKQGNFLTGRHPGSA
jgi:hypothetical protein